HRGVGHGKAVLATVGFRHVHDQVAAVAGGVKVVDHERAGRDRGLVDLHTVLGHHDLGVGVGHAAYHGRVAAQRLRQHAVVGAQLYAAQAVAVEHGAVGVAVAQAKHGTHVWQCALHVGVDVVPVMLARLAGDARLPGGGTVLPKLPEADVEAGTQAQVGAGLALPAAGGVIAVEVVVEQERRHARIPRGRIDPATRPLVHVGLRHGDVHAQVGHVEGQRGAGNQVAQAYAGGRRRQPPSRHGIGLGGHEAHAVEQLGAD